MTQSNIHKFVKDPLREIPSFEEALNISNKYTIPLHPEYLFYWTEFDTPQFILFLESLLKAEVEKEQVSFPFTTSFKTSLEVLGVEHSLKEASLEQEQQEVIIEPEVFTILLTNLGLKKYSVKDIQHLIKEAQKDLHLKPLEIINKNNTVEIRDKGGSYIGARMGRPEKAKMRKLDGRPHGLFPVGHGRKIAGDKEVGKNKQYDEVIQNRLRNIMESVQDGVVESDFNFYTCKDCGKETLIRVCIHCGGEGEITHYERYEKRVVKETHENAVRFKKEVLKLEPYINDVRKRLGISELPKLVKGIKGTSNKHHIVEHLLKAFLREKNGVYVNKDGTIRYDMIEMGITHFKPKEIGTSLKQLKELGYTHDYKGNEITSDDQLIEILPQDVILPDCSESGDELASEFVMRTGAFIDELLEKLYKEKPFYKFKKREDTIGHLIVGLAPHTSAGIIGRIIGFSQTQGCFSHPVWHAAQRRNLDGDENGIMLLLDALINFSRDYLPDRRGSRTMDTALVLTSHLYLDQIDDEVHGMDIVDHYPLELYKKAKEYVSPRDVKIERLGKRIDKKEIDEKYLGYQFTHSTDSINNTILCSSYKKIPLMVDKMGMQLELGTKIRAVDEHKVGSFIIDKHFMKDIKGNLRKFSMQSFRCTKCNTIFRRPPLVGRCTVCGAPSINFTISEGSIKKYIDPSFNIIENYNVDPYIVETLELVNLRIEGVFGKEPEKQKSLEDYWG